MCAFNALCEHKQTCKQTHSIELKMNKQLSANELQCIAVYVKNVKISQYAGEHLDSSSKCKGRLSVLHCLLIDNSVSLIMTDFNLDYGSYLSK